MDCDFDQCIGSFFDVVGDKRKRQFYFPADVLTWKWRHSDCCKQKICCWQHRASISRRLFGDSAFQLRKGQFACRYAATTQTISSDSPTALCHQRNFQGELPFQTRKTNSLYLRCLAKCFKPSRGSLFHPVYKAFLEQDTSINNYNGQCKRRKCQNAQGLVITCFCAANTWASEVQLLLLLHVPLFFLLKCPALCVSSTIDKR